MCLGDGRMLKNVILVRFSAAKLCCKTYLRYICIKFFMVLNFKVERLFVGR